MRLSANSMAVLERRYLARDKSGKVTETPEGMLRRVASNIASVEAKVERWLMKDIIALSLHIYRPLKVK